MGELQTGRAHVNSSIFHPYRSS